MVNIEVFEKKRIMRACARNFFLDKIYFLILFRIIVGARAPASAPAFSELRSDLRSGAIFGVALRPRSGFSERRSGAAIRGARRSNTLSR